MKRFIKRCISIIFIIIIFFYLFLLIKKDVFHFKEEKEEVIKVACVGDSLTFLRSLEGEKFINYPPILQEILGEKYDVTNYGQAGTCVCSNGEYPFRSLRVYRESVKCEADIVIIMIGTNDVWDTSWIDKEHFRKEYIDLIESYNQGDNKPRMFLCTLPKIFLQDGTTLETGFGERIEIISGVIREVADEKGYSLIDMNKYTSQHIEWYWKDKLHFSNEGAREVADVIANEIKVW